MTKHMGCVFLALALAGSGCTTDNDVCSSVTFAACGGDVVGVWTSTLLCPPPTRQDWEGFDSSACVDDYVRTRDTVDGITCELRPGGTAILEISQRTTGELRIRRDCVTALSGGEWSLEAVCAAYTDELDGARCEVAGDVCRCTINESRVDVRTGSYTTAGSAITLDGQAGEYCVSGSKLKLSLPDGLWGDGSSLTVLDRVGGVPAPDAAPLDARPPDAAPPDAAPPDARPSTPDAAACALAPDVAAAAWPYYAGYACFNTVGSQVACPSDPALADYIELDAPLNYDAAQDILILSLYSVGGPASFNLGAGAQANFATCWACVLGFADYDDVTAAHIDYFQTGGTLVIDSITPAAELSPAWISGRYSGVTLHEVSIDWGVSYNSTLVGSCSTTVGDASFSVPMEEYWF